MICPSCGTENTEGALACNLCAVPLQAPPGPGVGQPPSDASGLPPVAPQSPMEPGSSYPGPLPTQAQQKQKSSIDKRLPVILVLILVLLLAGVAIWYFVIRKPASSNTPSAVAQQFLKAMIAHDAPTSFGLLSMKFKGNYGVTAMTWTPYATTYNLISADATFTVKSENITGDTATVTILNRSGKESPVKLVREDGKWLVDYSLGESYGLQR